MKLPWLLTAAASLIAAACTSTTPEEAAICPLVAFPGILAEIRDDGGRPAARAALLQVADGSYRDSATGTWDSLKVGAAMNRAGRYDIQVSRPGYATVSRSNVRVPGGPCGANKPVIVPLTLKLLPNAPPVRSVTVIPPRAGFGRGYGTQYFAFVDAAPGLDQGVTWSLVDTSLATLTPQGQLTVKCNAPLRETDVIARSIADPRMTARAHFSVSSEDYPCR